MPADLNRVTLVGRLTKDPELRGQGDNPIASLRLAVTSRKKVADSWEDQPNYFDVTIFGRQAETAQKYLTKGRRIGVDGRLAWREWEKDGVRRQAVEIIANDIFFLDSKEQSDAPVSDLPVASVGASRRDEDIPF